MKRYSFALVAACTTATVSAQSSVTLFGVVDASISHYSVESTRTTAGRSQTVLGNGSYSASRIGLRGKEELGGGLSAGFWLESPLSNDDGGSVRPFNFSRRSTVSLSGPWGEVRLGRDYVPTVWNDIVFSPVGSPQGLGTSLMLQAAGSNLTSHPLLPADSNALRSNNSIGYFLPPGLGGIYGQFMYALHENPGGNAVLGDGRVIGIGSSRGRYMGGRIGYADGPLDIAVSYGESTLGNFSGTLAPPYGPEQFAAAYDAKVTTVNLGASYRLGAVKIIGELSQVKTSFDQPALVHPVTGLPLRASVSAPARNRGWLIGAQIPSGTSGIVAVAYSRLAIELPASEPTTSKLAVNYVHRLSKRTALYATAAYLKNKNGAAFVAGGVGNASSRITGAPNASSSGYEIGIQHSF